MKRSLKRLTSVVCAVAMSVNLLQFPIYAADGEITESNPETVAEQISEGDLNTSDFGAGTELANDDKDVSADKAEMAEEDEQKENAESETRETGKEKSEGTENLSATSEISMGSESATLLDDVSSEPTIWDGSVASSFAGGSGTKDNPYLISNGAELAYLAQSVNNGNKYNDKYFEMTNDIVLNDFAGWENWSQTNAPKNLWTPIGVDYPDKCFRGYFDGKDHVISGLYTLNGGLFNEIYGSVYNLQLESSFVYKEGITGGIAADLVGGSIKKCKNSAHIVGGTTGGIVGFNEGGDIFECDNSGTIEGKEKTGGIVGWAWDAVINGCENRGLVSGTKDVGGIAGNSATSSGGGSEIVDCANRGDVTCSGYYVGGIVGTANYESHSYLVEKCENYGAITGKSLCTGGIIGYCTASPLSGDSFDVRQCVNYGVVEGRDWYTGGIIGCGRSTYEDVEICDSYNVGIVSGIKYVGGICGVCYKEGYEDVRIFTSYNMGKLTGTSDVGGIIGNTTRVYVSDSYYVDNCGGTVRGGIALNAAQMKDAASYTGFDFDTVWKMGRNYPIFQWQMDNPEADMSDNENQTIIDRVSEYTSDEIYAQFNAISDSDYSPETKYKMWLDLFTSYGITDVHEGINYLSNTTDKRYAYLNLTNNDLYCASNFQYWLDHTAQGLATRALLLADGLVFNGEINDWLNFSTLMDTEYPGVAKYKAMLYDFMDSAAEEIELQSDIKFVSDVSKKITDTAKKLKADKLIDQLNACENIEAEKEILKSADALDIWAELSEERDESGEIVLKYKLDESSGFGQFSKAMGQATKGISIVDMTVTDILDILTLDSKLAVYAQYKTFLQDVVSNTEYIPFQMRWAASIILTELEEGYYGKIKDVVVDVFEQTKIDTTIRDAALEKVGASSFGSWLTAINVSAFFINKLVADIGGMVKNEAYVEGYAYLASAFTKQLEESKQRFLLNKTEANAWDFYYNYNVLYRLRYKGEEAYLAMTKVDGIAALFSDYGYSAKEAVVNETLEMLAEKCKFTFNEATNIPESRQLAIKSVISCPVNVDVYAPDGTLVASLQDGKECDVTNEYGRFVVLYDAYSGDYVKVICLFNKENFDFKLTGTDDGLVNMELAQAGEGTVDYTFSNVPIQDNMVIEANLEQITQEKTYSIDSDGDGVSEDEGTVFERTNYHKKVEKISLSESTLSLRAGENAVLQVQVSPDDASDQAVSWQSADSSVATVRDGKVTAVAPGKTKIVCTSLDRTLKVV